VAMNAAPELSVPARAGAEVVWHDLECGSYTADLPLWRELAGHARTRGADGRVLEIGAGSGRVSLDLARRGHAITALDLDGELLDALRARAARIDAAQIDAVCADARTFALARRDFALCIVAMQTLQLLGGAAGRRQLLARARSHLAPGGVLACAIVTELDGFDTAAGDPEPPPDLARRGGRLYVSRATRVRVSARSVLIERARGVLEDRQDARAMPRAWARHVERLDRVSVERLQREGAAAGLTAVHARAIPATSEHAGSVAVIFRA
jgi:SAM-dependent methyltransferase